MHAQLVTDISRGKRGGGRQGGGASVVAEAAVGLEAATTAAARRRRRVQEQLNVAVVHVVLVASHRLRRQPQIMT